MERGECFQEFPVEQRNLLARGQSRPNFGRCLARILGKVGQRSEKRLLVSETRDENDEIDLERLQPVGLLLEIANAVLNRGVDD